MCVLLQTQRNAANARERSRMRVLSKAFSRLKTSLPWVPADTKLSKLDTLRLASSYISHLRQILQEDRLQSCGHPVNLVLLTRSHTDTRLKRCNAIQRLYWHLHKQCRHGNDLSTVRYIYSNTLSSTIFIVNRSDTDTRFKYFNHP